MFGKNEKAYLKILVNTRIAINKLNKIGLWRWQMKFSPKFNFFINRKELEKFREENTDRIDNFFKKEIDAKIQKINETLTSN